MHSLIAYLLGRSAHSCATLRRCRPSVDLLEDRVQMSVTPAGLGAASGLAVLEMNHGILSVSTSHIKGDVGLGQRGLSVLQKADINGKFIADPTAFTGLSRQHKGFNPTGGIITSDLSQAGKDATAASAADAALAPTQVLGNVSKSLTVSGNGYVNIIAVSSVAGNRMTLTLNGGATEYFVFNVSGNFTFAQSKIVLSGGVTADHVLFNFPTAGRTIDVSRAGTVLNGTFLAPARTVNVQNQVTANGAILARTVNLQANATVNGVPFAPPLSSLSGHVTAQTDVGSTVPVSGASVLITWVDKLGVTHNTTLVTDSTGAYVIAGLSAGTYTIDVSAGANLTPAGATVGTVNGSTDGVFDPDNMAEITGITINDGDVGINYDFVDAELANS